MSMSGKLLFSYVLLSMFSVTFLSQPVYAQENCYELKLDAPITTWDEAIPLGNGMLGVLLWGKDNTINLSLDRGDLWDETLTPEILEAWPMDEGRTFLSFSTTSCEKPFISP